MTLEAFSTAMAMLCEMFGKVLKEAALDAYRLALDELSDEELGRATKTALKTCRFMPTPVELLTFVGKAPNPAANAATAWEYVRRAMDTHDYTRSVDFGPLVNAVVRNLGGWYWLCDQKLTALPFVRKDFEHLYEAFSAKRPEELAGDYLEGWLHEAPQHIAIPGSPAPDSGRALPSMGQGEIADVIRRLANDKSV